MNDYVDQSALELNLCVFNGIPNLEGSGTRLFEERRAEVSPGINVHLGIIGASHIFSFSIGDSFRMTEMLACTEPPAFDGYTLKMPLGMIAGDGRNHEMPLLMLPFPGVLYTFDGFIEEANEEALADIAKVKRGMREVASKEPNTICLEHDFGSHGSGGATYAFPPETLVQFSWLSEGIALLNTVHTYPNEGKLVYTTTSLIVDMKKQFLCDAWNASHLKRAA